MHALINFVLLGPILHSFARTGIITYYDSVLEQKEKLGNILDDGWKKTNSGYDKSVGQ